MAALQRINPAVQNEAQAKLAISTLRAAMSHGDKLTANRQTLDLLRDGAKIVLTPGAPAATVQFIAFEAGRQSLNDYTATNQYRVQGVRQCREDTVLLVNGIPLVVAEYKSYVTSRHDWKEAVRQLHRYQRQAPQLLAPNVFCVAADEQEFRYGPILFHDASKEDIDRHLDLWGRWLSLYPETRGYWNDPKADDPDDSLAVPVKGLLRLSPCHVLDFLQHFVVFETKKGKTTKKVARYQQFEAVNDIVDRTVGLVGQPATPRDRTGLVWHTQGSGKSLTMICAAQKLRRHPALRNPTVLIVIDRRDLKTQLSDDFEACDYPNVEKALGIDDLKRKLKAGWRGTLVTTLQCFQDMGDLEPIERDDIVSLVDECHRSQKGTGSESFAMTMRVKLANAFRFGFTGTPIDRTMNNTHRDFGPIVEGQQERYLSYYGIRRAIRDGATLEVHYLRDKVPFVVAESALSADYEAMCREMEVEDEAAKDVVQREQANWKELARHPERVGIVLDKMLEHFLAHPNPSGFKAQLVGVDRKACALYKLGLDERLSARQLPPEWSDVIISASQNSEPLVAGYEYDKQKQDDLIDYFKLTPSEWEAWNHERFGKDRSTWRPPLKILIVCDRLLTGFDAPVEQVMYLDKPLRDHTLLQAIARTNRPLPAMKKRTGLIVDYFGVFDDLEKALNFDESVREQSLIDWDKLKEVVPDEVKRAMATFEGIAIEDTRACLLAALRRLKDEEAAQAFERNFRSLERIWEALSPDPCLYPHRFHYAWLCSIYVAYRRQLAGSKDTHGELSAKTRELIRQHTTFMSVAEALPVFRIDADLTANVADLPTPADKAAAFEAALTSELVEGELSFVYRQLGERLRRIKEERDQSDAATEKRLRALEALAEEVASAKKEPELLNLHHHPAAYGLFGVLRAHAPGRPDDVLAVCANSMITSLRKAGRLHPGWSQSVGGRMRVEQSLLAESWLPQYAELGFDPNAEDPPFLRPAVAELAAADAG